MLDLDVFRNCQLRGGFTIVEVERTAESMADAIGREAAAQTRITASEFRLRIVAWLDERELSVTLYHEVLEAATVASPAPPHAMSEFNEGDFERTARLMHEHFGPASPANLNRMLERFGF